MSRKTAGVSFGRFRSHFGRNALIFVGLAALGTGVYVGTAKRTHSPQVPNVERQPTAQRPPGEALQLLSELRGRFASAPAAAINASPDPAEPSSPLLPGLVDDFEKDTTGLLPQFAAALGTPDARVVLPTQANAPFDIAHISTGARIEAKLDDVRDTAAEIADGYVVYKHAHASGATLLRRAMPNGNEDFLSFEQAPTDPRISYSVKLDQGIAGLRLVSNTLEFLDNTGTPRLRVAPPYIVSADGGWLEAKLDIEGCAVDGDTTAPWQRAVTEIGASSCKLNVSWADEDVIYPAILDPTWMTTGSMATARQGHTATVLSTGKVLVAGGTNGSTTFATAELYDRTTGTWAATGSMTGARQLHTAVQLNTSGNPTTSGKVLIAGGKNGSTSLNTAQLYSPSAGTWVAASNLNAARHQHTASLLTSGKVLVVGGLNGTATLATAAFYDPTTGGGTWTATVGPLPSMVKSHTATLLSTTNQQLNGKVLVCGGNNGTSSIASVYLYDPAQNAFSTLANLPSAREGQTATVLSNGKLLLAGGKNGSATLNTAVVFDPATGPGAWSTTGNMTVARQQHTANLLGNGQVLVAGGSNGSSSLSSAELYNGTSWSATTAMPAAVQAHTASTLANGIILVAGGLNGSTTQSSARLYDVTGGNTCTTGSQCASGNCVSGVCCNTACTDQCSACNLTGLVGICSPKTNGTACSDNNACTASDTCQAGTCQPGSPLPTDDQNPCTADSCNPITGVAHTPLAAGTSCSDGNACNGAETCNSSAVCIAGTPPAVDDNNPCTADSCVPATGVVHQPLAAGTSCADTNACNGNEICNATGTCLPGTPVTCTASGTCHIAGQCNPADGTCSNPNAPDGTSCSDNNACTASDTCQAGSCQAGSPVAVDDNNPCTADACDTVAGVSHTPLAAGTSCSDSNLCNGAETCNASAICIAGTPPPVDDNNPCTADSCVPATGVVHQPLAAGTSCADNDACNGNEVCNATGTCLPGTPVTCTASGTCHIAGQCNPANGTCSNPNAPDGTSCSDNNACTTGDSCQAGSCQSGSPVAVDDGNPCTADTCDSVNGVAHTPVPAGTTCTDGNICTGAGTCNASGTCMPGTIPELDDNNPCTADACDPVNGVTHTPVAPGTSCADSNVCNGSETCGDFGNCLPGTTPSFDDGNACTADSCDPVTGVAHTPVAAGTSCADGDACNGNETCNAAGTCAPGTPLTLDDGNPCTADSCDPTTGSVNHDPMPAGAPCSSNDVCNSGQTCSTQGQCQGGTPVNVDDGDPATIDTCEPGIGVKHRHAAAIDKTVITTTLAANQWLFAGPDPIQTGVAPDTIVLQRAAVIHGYVTAPFHRTERVLMGDMSYSLDLRKKVLEALEAESSSNVVAARFGVSGSFVRKLRARVRETGEPEAIPPPGKARIVDSKGEAIMRDLVDDRPDATLGKLASLFRRHGGRKISETTTWRTLRRMGLSLKKRPSTQRNAIDPMLSSPGKNSKSKARSGTLPG